MSLLSILIIGILLFVPARQGMAGPKPIQLKLGIMFPPGNGKNLSDLEWIKKVDERTGGKAKVKYYQGTMGKPNELLDFVWDGVGDVVHISTGITLAYKIISAF